MNLRPYAESLRRDLLAAAATGPDATRRTAEHLVETLEPAVRRTILDALTDATADVKSVLSGVMVEVRRHGPEPRIGCTPIDPEPGGRSITGYSHG